jgi:hypothetical protein
MKVEIRFAAVDFPEPGGPTLRNGGRPGKILKSLENFHSLLGARLRLRRPADLDLLAKVSCN